MLFLDCVYQLHCQFPCSFEFGTHLLVILFEHSFSSQYGTFLSDCERERDNIRLHKKTTSLWSYLNRPDVLKSLLNPIYEPNQSVIWPSVAPISLVLWSGQFYKYLLKKNIYNIFKLILYFQTDLYLRWVIDQSQTKSVLNQIQCLITREKELRSKAIRLRKQLLDLSKEYFDMVSNKEIDDA